MVGGAPIASRPIADRKPAAFSPISIFITETITLQDSIGEIDVQATLGDTITLQDSLTPPSVQATFMEVIRLKDYLIALVNGQLSEIWTRTDLPSETTWTRTDLP